MAANAPPPPPSSFSSRSLLSDEFSLNVRTIFELFLDEFESAPVSSHSHVHPPSHHSHSHREVSQPSAESAHSKFYVQRCAEMKVSGSTTMYVDVSHLRDYSVDLYQSIRLHYYRVEPFLCVGIESFVRRHSPDHDALKSKQPSFHVGFYNFPTVSSIRELKTNRIGHLLSIGGTVTRTSAVRPELTEGTFVCLECGTVNRGVRQQFRYTEPTMCINGACPNRLRWSLDPNESSFADFQLVKLQENSNEIPPGSMPRAIKVIVRHELVEVCKPGDKCQFIGHLIVVPEVGAFTRRIADSVKFDRSNTRRVGEGVTGMKGAGNIREVNYSLAFVANSVRSSTQHSGAYATPHAPNPAGIGEGGNDDENVMESFTPTEMERIMEMKSRPKLFSRLVKSIAPNIFGHDEIKRGLLLMLMGGVHKVTKDRANLRGDINVCIVGDPSTSKSQFLKFVCQFSPRAVYTSGKASSAAGLTASVVRDVETGEFGIEAGALMLADNGICCIDEFDKMEVTDQVAIHEAMEQQTISIAKAGIQATLNARTSVLAAANPIRGRYDKSKTLKQNVDISAPIMSRFDLFFVVLDEQDEVVDYNLARHIIDVHTNKKEAIETEFSLKDLQNYVRFARSMKPTISPEAKRIFVENYLSLRANDSMGVNKIAYRITVRQLESLIRLSEARARVDLAPEVTPAHVKQAAELLKLSIVKVEAGDVDLTEMDEYEERREEKAEEKTPETEGSPRQRSPGLASLAAVPSSSGRLELRFDDYERLCLLLVRHMRSLERQGKPPLTFGELVEFYLHSASMSKEIQTEEDLKHHAKLIRLVILRLIQIDRVIQVVKTKPRIRELEKKILVVHPNFAEEQQIEEHRKTQVETEGDDGEGEMQDGEKEKQTAKPKTRTPEPQEVLSSDSEAEDKDKPAQTGVRTRGAQETFTDPFGFDGDDGDEQ